MLTLLKQPFLSDDADACVKKERGITAEISTSFVDVKTNSVPLMQKKMEENLFLQEGSVSWQKNSLKA